MQTGIKARVLMLYKYSRLDKYSQIIPSSHRVTSIYTYTQTYTHSFLKLHIGSLSALTNNLPLKIKHALSCSFPITTLAHITKSWLHILKFHHFKSNAHSETSLHICEKCHALYHVVPLGILSNYFIFLLQVLMILDSHYARKGNVFSASIPLKYLPWWQGGKGFQAQYVPLRWIRIGQSLSSLWLCCCYHPNLHKCPGNLQAVFSPLEQSLFFILKLPTLCFHFAVPTATLLSVYLYPWLGATSSK